MPEIPSQRGSLVEIEQDTFLVAELNYRETYTLHPIKALKEWLELVAEFKARGMSDPEITEMSWDAQERANTFNLDKALINAE